MALWLVFLSVLLLNAFLGEAQPLGLAGCKTQCGGIDIPYPFGMKSGCYLGESYQILCQGSDPVKAFINRTDLLLEVMKISVEEALVQVRFPIANTCERGKDNVTVDLDGTPFVLSSANNKLIAVGCNNLALMTQNESTVGGCISICEEASKAFRNNTCNGIECCQTTIPSNLKVFNLTLKEIDQDNKGRGRCKYACLVDQSSFNSSSDNPCLTGEWCHVEG